MPESPSKNSIGPIARGFLNLLLREIRPGAGRVNALVGVMVGLLAFGVHRNLSQVPGVKPELVNTSGWQTVAAFIGFYLVCGLLLGFLDWWRSPSRLQRRTRRKISRAVTKGTGGATDSE